MKHTTEELLLAAAIRERAAEIRNARARSMPAEEVERFKARPANDFIADALDEFSRIAVVVKKLREADVSQPGAA